MTAVILNYRRLKMGKMVSKSKFKPKSLEYFRQIEESGEEIIITDHGRPVLKVVPYSAEPAAVQLLHNSVKKYKKPTEPVGVEGWEGAKGLGLTPMYGCCG